MTVMARSPMNGDKGPIKLGAQRNSHVEKGESPEARGGVSSVVFEPDPHNPSLPSRTCPSRAPGPRLQGDSGFFFRSS